MKPNELFDLTGRVALVTGASSGLGVRFAEVLAGNGAKVVLVARRADRLDTLRKKIEAAGGVAVVAEADVLDRAAMVRAFDTAEQAFGTVTILVNNAGVTHADRVAEMTEAEWRRVLGTNLDAVLYWAQEAARRMLAAKQQGAIVNIASILGFGVAKGVAAYAVAKAGVVQLTRALALELAFKGVRVNAIAPGFVVTEINEQYLAGKGADMTRHIPVGRFGETRDLDGALLLLASDAGRFMAGSTIVVDGGQMLAFPGVLENLLQRRHAELRGAPDRQDRLAELVGDFDFLSRVLAARDDVAHEVVLLVVDRAAVLLDRRAEELLAHDQRCRGPELVGKLHLLLLELFCRREAIAGVMVELDSRRVVRGLRLRDAKAQRGRRNGRQRDDRFHHGCSSCSRDGTGALRRLT